jgi:hypothetical protein
VAKIENLRMGIQVIDLLKKIGISGWSKTTFSMIRCSVKDKFYKIRDNLPEIHWVISMLS